MKTEQKIRLDWLTISFLQVMLVLSLLVYLSGCVSVDPYKWGPKWASIDISDMSILDSNAENGVVDLSGQFVDRKTVRKLVSRKNIVELDLSYAEFPLFSSCLSTILSSHLLNSVRVLNLNNQKLSRSHLSQIGRFAQLEELSLAYTGISGTQLDSITNLSCLFSLDLVGNDGVNDQTLLSLSGLKSLTHLYLDGTGVSAMGMHNFEKLSDLRVLTIGCCAKMDSYDWLDQCNQLTEISLSNVDKAAITYASRLDNLETCIVYNSIISVDVMQRLLDIKKLRKLSLTNCRFDSSEAVAKFSAFSHLQALDLNDSDLQHTAFDWLMDLAAIEELYLRNTGIKDEHLAFLKGSTQLSVLDISNCSISDKGLLYLELLPNLRKVRMYNTMVTEAGVLRLSALLKKAGYRRHAPTSGN